MLPLSCLWLLHSESERASRLAMGVRDGLTYNGLDKASASVLQHLHARVAYRTVTGHHPSGPRAHQDD
jgi:hypothetical protein